MDELTISDLALEPAADMIRWAEARLPEHALSYRRAWTKHPLTEDDVPAVELRCSACKKRMIADNWWPERGCSHSYRTAPFGFFSLQNESLIDGDTTLCPSCGAEVKAIYAGRCYSDHELRRLRVLDVRNVKERLCLIFWNFRKTVDECADAQVKYSWEDAFVVEREHLRRFCGGQNGYKAQYKDVIGPDFVLYPFDPAVLVGTTGENSKLDLFLKTKKPYPVSYLRLWVQRRQAENLLVQGAGELLSEMLRADVKPRYACGINVPKLPGINWREKRPAQMLGLTKDQFRYLVKQQWSEEELELFKALSLREIIHPETDIPLLRNVGWKNVRHLLTHTTEGAVMKAIRYLARQEKKDAVTLVDYWRLAAANGCDLNDPSVRWPQDLHRAHDRETERQRFNKHQGYEPQFARRTQVLDAYAWEKDGLLIRPARSAEELYREGKALHHCVYSYLESHVKGNTAIFFIRRTEAPEESFFTLELDEINVRVRQNRGLRNCGRTQEVTAFEKAWLNFVLEQKLKLGEEYPYERIG